MSSIPFCEYNKINICILLTRRLSFFLYCFTLVSNVFITMLAVCLWCFCRTLSMVHALKLNCSFVKFMTVQLFRKAPNYFPDGHTYSYCSEQFVGLPLTLLLTNVCNILFIFNKYSEYKMLYVIVIPIHISLIISRFEHFSIVDLYALYTFHLLLNATHFFWSFFY